MILFLFVIPFHHFYQNGGSYILAADASPESVLSVWQWQWGHLLGKVAVRMLLDTQIEN